MKRLSKEKKQLYAEAFKKYDRAVFIAILDAMAVGDEVSGPVNPEMASIVAMGTGAAAYNLLFTKKLSKEQALAEYDREVERVWKDREKEQSFEEKLEQLSQANPAEYGFPGFTTRS